MATISVCDRSIEGKCIRKKIPDVSLDINVLGLKGIISKNIERPVKSFDVIFCGQCLKEEASLQSCGLHSGSTVHLLPALSTQESPLGSTSSKENKETIKSMIKQLQTALKSPAYKPTIEGIMSDPAKLQDIVNAVPELNNNPATLTLFMDQDLLKVLAHPGNVRRLLDAHPSLPSLVQLLCDRVTAASSSGQFTSGGSGASYSLDHMSDDDDEDAPGPSGGPSITANQLAAALAAAAASAGITPVTPSTAQASSSQPIGNNMITQDFFQQAIQQAQRGSLTSQLEQMREMGITDENVARQALQATNGDLQAALDLLLGEGMS